MIDVVVEHQEDFIVRASPEEAFQLVADVRRSGLHFPGVARLDPVDDKGRWRWTMEERGFGPLTMKVSYDAVYRIDEADKRVSWAPPPTGRGDMDSEGSWRVDTDASGRTRMRFAARTVAHIPIPRLMGKMAEVVTREELGKLKKDYVAAIARTLGV
jgi:carbon monoxide dehydrogenase subunit G